MSITTPTAVLADTTSLVPSADAYVSKATPTTNYGTAATLSVGGKSVTRSYLMFYVPTLNGKVATAQLALHADSSGSGFNVASSASTTWTETTIDYQNAPPFGPIVSKTKGFTAGQTVTVSVSGIVRGSGTYTLVLTSGAAGAMTFDSREGANPPQLVVTTYPPYAPTPTPTATPSTTPTPGTSPIQHIVIFYQENHTFDNVLGPFCEATMPARCDGRAIGATAPTSSGVGTTITQATDLIPGVTHNSASQTSAIDNGLMDRFDQINGCGSTAHYACYSAFAPAQIPNLTNLATTFAVSDRTFSLSAVPSWGAHLELVAATLDGFTGDNPGYRPHQSPPPPPDGGGWGCDSNTSALWAPTTGATPTLEPACIPDPGCATCSFPSDHAYGGAYASSPAQYVPTIMDELDTNQLSWKLYTEQTKGTNGSYKWSICPSFAECLYSNQSANMVPTEQFVTDATNGTLPSFSVLLPTAVESDTSQHNGTSMAEGDNWIGQAMGALMNGPDWGSTAVFITYDDCGCFYDHVAPPAGEGIRVPMVIVSPYARAAYTDSTPANFASMLAFTEHTFGLAPLSPTSPDATAYDFSSAFDYSQTPIRPVAMTQQTISPAERAYLAAHPPSGTDPT